MGVKQTIVQTGGYYKDKIDIDIAAITQMYVWTYM